MTNKALLQENERLRARLTDAEETLGAIRNGEVDAIVVAGPHGDRVFSLEDANTPYRVLIEQMNEGALSLSAEGTVVYCNRRFAEFVKRPLDQVMGMAFDSFVVPEQHAALGALLQMDADGHSNGEIDFLLEDASVLPMRLSMRQLPTGSVGVACIVATDMTEAKRAQQDLQLAANVFIHAREGISITSARGCILEVNDMFTHITGYGRDEVIGQNPRILQSGRQSREFYVAMWKSLVEQGHWSGEIWNRRKSGEVYAEVLTISSVRDASGALQNYVALFSDITLMKEHEQQLENIAHYDALTQLPNRALLADRLTQALLHSQRRGKMLAVAYLDLDGFKQVNDRHGHAVGDDLLIAVAQHMKEALREGDTLARVGGDEFVAVLVDLEGALDCEPLLERLLQAASQWVPTGDIRVQVSASIGVTFYPQDGADADLLLRQADQAMYIAKAAGKNQHHIFDVASADAVRSQRESLERIRHALAQCEFVLYYQPKVNMATGAVIGAEALIRWQHPQRGLLAPAAFLPLIEGHSISVDLGDWVINSALAQIVAWQVSGLKMPVSVNVGASQLLHGDFVARLSAALGAHPEVPPMQLELEILETSALKDMAQVSSLMRACLGLGVGFALDDFGPGYSSLTYLKHLPAALLKIDQSFVRDMLTDADDLAIVQGVIGLAGAFHRSVIAEGVETKALGDRLLSLGCELAQGYGIARPMPADDLPGWVVNWQEEAIWTA